MRRGTRTIRIDTLAVLVLLAASLWPDVSRAQSFPADASWLPLRCRGAVMTDAWRDQGGAHDERDLVGDPGSPAGLRAFDQRFLYLRLRLDSDPAPGGALRPFSWGYQLDTDGRNDTYEILLLVRGNDKLIALQRNSTTTVANSTSDPADEPPVVTYPFSTHGRTVVASGSSFGGNADYFIDVAVPWSDLAQVQLTPTTIALGWAGTSSTANSLSNGDLACHDGASGAPTLSGTAPEGITIVPAASDGDGDGFSDQKEIAAGTNPNDAQSFPATGEPDAPIIAGGAGCAVAPEAAPAGGALVLLMLSLAALAARRVRRERAAEISGEERLSLLAEWRGSPYEKTLEHRSRRHLSQLCWPGLLSMFLVLPACHWIWPFGSGDPVRCSSACGDGLSCLDGQCRPRSDGRISDHTVDAHGAPGLEAPVPDLGDLFLQPDRSPVDGRRHDLVQYQGISCGGPQFGDCNWCCAVSIVKACIHIEGVCHCESWAPGQEACCCALQ